MPLAGVDVTHNAAKCKCGVSHCVLSKKYADESRKTIVAIRRTQFLMIIFCIRRGPSDDAELQMLLLASYFIARYAALVTVI